MYKSRSVAPRIHIFSKKLAKSPFAKPHSNFDLVYWIYQSCIDGAVFTVVQFQTMHTFFRYLWK